MRGCSSVVERHVANVDAVGSSPITRSSSRSRWMSNPSAFLKNVNGGVAKW
jgi:hypothetical protein